ncbi:interleukin-18 receptor 1-like [Plectropomus leopardus]|uniref:interleukin-18 receptor 1-like n=1 Tax=Plectropomus leopardus TaxID=160734 RepID=UPI001C4C6C3D|nr:interleukin-18 receptor 1-like [Plectropomus leopardus]
MWRPCSQNMILTALESVCCAVLQDMMVKVLLLHLCFLFASFQGVCPQTLRVINVKAGEMVALYCPCGRGTNIGDAEVTWSSYTSQETHLSNMSSAQQRQMGLLVHGRSLVVFNASVKHEGNYTCSHGNAGRSSWFRLTVYTTQTEESTQYPQTCYTQETCTLYCPAVNIPAANIPNITSNGIVWHKEGESWSTDGYRSRVEKKDQGVYTCTRSYLYYGQIYNMTFTVELDVQPKKKTEKPGSITSPKEGERFPVDLGAPKVIDCEAVIHSDSDDVFWHSGESVVERNSSFPVYYNVTREDNAGEIKITVSLVFRNMSKDDLSKNYTCKLQSDSEMIRPKQVTITLAQKPRHSNLPQFLGFAGIFVVMVLTEVIYVRFKIDITLFLRDTLGCHSRTSDGKSYDAFLMYYKSDTDAGLNACDRKWLESVLEEKFGYSLCLYDRDVSLGTAVADAVLDSVEQSRTVILVPASPDPGPGSGLLSAIHAALVERQTRLIFIKTEGTEVLRSGSLQEALQLLSEAGDRVTWKGTSFMPPSSSFWKQLRYYLPAPQRSPKISLFPQTV